MFSDPKKRFVRCLAASLALAFALGLACPVLASADDGCDDGHDDTRAFVRRHGAELRLAESEFRFGGANNYYLMYKSPFMVDSVLTAAQVHGFTVLRTWGFVDIGNQDGSNSVAAKADGTVYFHYWNGAAPDFNDGADGLVHLDYVIYRAGQMGLKVVVPFVNNWSDFGGMDQYVRWLGGQYHDQFYTDTTIRGWYEAWIAHLLNRKNTYTGVAYKDDPTIMTWELANEPRCTGSGAYPASSTCATGDLVRWADDVSRFVKGIDHRHLVSVGDEGFYCIPGAADWTQNCSQGVDTIAFASLPNVDLMSLHLYPDYWGQTVAWGAQWIRQHIADARSIGRPAMLGEFGLLAKASRNPAYQQWTDAVFDRDGAGATVWMLAGQQDGGSLYPDYDGFTLYSASPVSTTISHFAARMAADRPLPFAPVADDLSATTAFETAVTLDPVASSIAYGRTSVAPSSVDLDPATAGQQTTFTTAAGTFTAGVDGTVAFAPAANFSGTAVQPYTVDDGFGRESNAAALSVTVKPNPLAAILLASFETDAQGWAPASWQTGVGSTQQTTAFATDGTHALEVDTLGTSGAWVGVQFASPVDLSAKTDILADVATSAVGTSANIAIQVGSAYTWCQNNNWGYVNPNTTTTIDLPFSQLSCASPDLTQVHALWIFFSSPGTFYLDYVRAENL